jgi:hypothetical protein
MTHNVEFESWAKELSEKLDKLGLGFMWHKLQERNVKTNVN